jgi:hypothetical protein
MTISAHMQNDVSERILRLLNVNFVLACRVPAFILSFKMVNSQRLSIWAAAVLAG